MIQFHKNLSYTPNHLVFSISSLKSNTDRMFVPSLLFYYNNYAKQYEQLAYGNS